MAPQQHKVMRLVLEVHGGSRSVAQRVQLEFNDACRERLLSLIEEICSDLSASDRIHRVDSLIIDLGKVPLDTLDAAVADKFAAAFGRKLGAAIDTAPEIDSELELFGCFIRTGTLPWWADASDPNLLLSAVQSLIKRIPQALCRTVLTAPDPERARRRIVRTCTDRLLDDLVCLLAPPLSTACPDLGGKWMSILGALSGAQGNSAPAGRTVVWEEILRAAGAGATTAAEASRFFGAVLVRVAYRMGGDYRSLVANLKRSLDDRTGAVPKWARDISEGLWRDLDRDLEQARESAIPSHGSARAEPDRRLARGVDGYAVMSRQSGTPAPERSAAIATQFDAKRFDGITAATSSARESESPAESVFSNGDAIYVYNAGLVALWPFLENFCSRLGLLQDRRFRDEAAAHRAAGLLQYVASGDESAAEYLLPLNKVLCGIALEEVFDFGAEINAEEFEECENLFAAVIQHAPILRGMSVPGFRGSFLLRKGQLGSRDGSWLLRVQRETHDVVLDRFPWSVDIVKLPWMDARLQVEW